MIVRVVIYLAVVVFWRNLLLFFNNYIETKMALLQMNINSIDYLLYDKLLNYFNLFGNIITIVFVIACVLYEVFSYLERKKHEKN